MKRVYIVCCAKTIAEDHAFFFCDEPFCDAHGRQAYERERRAWDAAVSGGASNRNESERAH